MCRAGEAVRADELLWGERKREAETSADAGSQRRRRVCESRVCLNLGGFSERIEGLDRFTQLDI